MKKTKEIYTSRRYSILASFMITTLIVGLMTMVNPLPATRAIGAIPIKVGLITDVAGIDDNGFNQLSYQGMLRAQTDFGILPVYYESEVEADYVTNLVQCVVDGNDLCITVGFLLDTATLAAALTFPTTKFAIVDYDYTSSYPNNLRGINFNVGQPAYLAGVLAGLMSQTKIIGDIAGMEIPTVTAFTEAYHNGALCANPNTTVKLVYAGDFYNPTLGAQIAQIMISQGADVIFSPAGLTGTGAVLSATQSGIWGIGVDTDWYLNVFGKGAVAGADKLLTSVLKKVDNAVYLTIKDVVLGTFTSGKKVYSMADDGTGLAPYHETDTLIPSAIKIRLNQVKADILSGKINVNSSYCPRYIYLPSIIR